MKKTEFKRRSNDGMTDLHIILWEPSEAPKGVLQLVHGMVEHIARYDEFATYLANRGYAVIGHDHLGHGESVSDESKYGFFAAKNGAATVLADMHLVTEEGKNRFPGVKFGILGHSMGSFFTRKYLSMFGREMDFAVVMSTGFIPWFMASFGKNLSRLTATLRGDLCRSKLLTTLALGGNNKPFEPAKTEWDWTTKDEAIIAKRMADPWCLFDFTARGFADFFTVITDLTRKPVYGGIPKTLPMLLTSGEVDPVGGKKAVESLAAQYKSVGMENVTVQIYPDDRHEILNETDRETVFQNIEQWISGVIG